MPLTAGTRLGPYEIVDLLGAGGMGDAYYSNRGDEYALWTIDPDGSRARARVAMRGAAPLFAVWSPDGQRIAGSAGGVWVYSFDTKAFTPITPGSQPAWFADGKRLVYSAARRLRVVDTATKQSHEIYAIPGETLLSAGLTKDNRFLYYQHATTGADIWVMTIK